MTRTNEDTLISALKAASELWANGVCKRSFAYNDYELYTSCFDGVELGNSPIDVPTVVVSYIPYGETSYTVLSDTAYRIDESFIEPRLEIIDTDFTYPLLANRNDAVKVSYSGGFETVPENVKTAILLKLATLYDNRVEENKRWMTSAEYLLMPYRIYNV